MKPIVLVDSYGYFCGVVAVECPKAGDIVQCAGENAEQYVIDSLADDNGVTIASVDTVAKAVDVGTKSLCYKRKPNELPIKVGDHVVTRLWKRDFYGVVTSIDEEGGAKVDGGYLSDLGCLRTPLTERCTSPFLVDRQSIAFHVRQLWHVSQFNLK